MREEQFVVIGGIEQWVTIRGQNKENPVLVIVHGGPASPYTPLNSWLTEWERYFTIVQWDQRGAGKTWSKSGPPPSLSFQAITDDGIAVVKYAQKRLGKDKVVLLGSSVGSFIGVMMVHQHPELFSAYVGTEQNAPGGIDTSYALTYAATQEKNSKKGLALLSAMSADKSAWTYKQFLAMNKLSISVTKDSPHMVNDIMLPGLLFAPDYTMSDIQAVQKGMEYSAERLFDEIRNFDFAALGYDFAVPFYVLQGENDIITPVASAKAYVERIRAPKKAFVTIAHAGHMAEFCQPSQFLIELRRVLSE